MNPTNNAEKMRTYPLSNTKSNPWRAPGYAPVESPCGLAGGWYTQGAPGNGGYPPTGIKQGRDGRTMPMPVGVHTTWKAGSTQKVSWSITANHGGGYAYRLCAKNDARNLSEACFAEGNLKFANDETVITYANGTLFTIPALTVSEGTHPEGSQWRRNPIPACSGPYGGSRHKPGCDKSQFTPPLPGLYGFGLGRCDSGLPGQSCGDDEEAYWRAQFNFMMVDQVLIPANTPTGDYVVSFRWDCEQTPQIWADCSDVTIA